MAIATPQFPTALDDATTLLEAVNNAKSTLNASITAVSTSLLLVDASDFPNAGVISCQEEIIHYTGKSGNSLTGLIRGAEGTTAASHASGKAVRMTITATYHNNLRAVVVELQKKVGKGSSLPSAGKIAVGQADGSTRYYDPAIGIPGATISEGSDANAVKLNVALDTQEMEGALAAKHYDKGGMVYHVNAPEYGGKADGVQAAGTAVATNTTFNASTAVFQVGRDEGKLIWLDGVGTGGTLHQTTIASVTDSDTVVLTSAPPLSSGCNFWFGTDNTTAFSDTQTAILAAGGGGILQMSAGAYMLQRISLEPCVELRGCGIDATYLWSAVTTGGIVESVHTINSSNAVNINARGFTIHALNDMNFAGGVVETCGTYFRASQVRCVGTHYDFILDQTEVSKVSECRFEGWAAPYVGAMIGAHDPADTSGSYTAGAWTKVGSGTTASDGTRWNINATVACYYNRTINSTAARKGFTILFKMPEVASGSQVIGFDDGTRRHTLTLSTSGVSLNGGTARSALQSHYVRLEIATGGATATLKINGSATDSNVAAQSSGTPNPCVFFGNLSGTSNVYWQDIEYQASNPLPACLWITNGDDWTPSASAEFTNANVVKDNQFNAEKVHVAIDGGYGWKFADNNHNGGLNHYRIASPYAVIINNLDYEAHKWDSIRIGVPGLQRSAPNGSPSGIVVFGGLMAKGAVPGFPAIDVKAANSASFLGIHFPALSGYNIRCNHDGSVADINEAGCSTGDSDIFDSLTSDYPYINSQFTSHSDRKSQIYKLSTRRVEVKKNVLSAGSTATLDLALGNDHEITLTASCTLTITHPFSGNITLKIKQDATGGRTITWPRSCIGTPPTLNSSANAVTIVRLYCDGTNLYF